MIVCSTCSKPITDGMDEEECIECREILCLDCFQEDFICKECEEETE